MSERFYFRGLDAYRGFAAILVILGHIEQVKKINHITNFFDNGPFIFHLGSIAVTFFFVLSGFLITFLILKEEKENTTINISAFYMRRVLRLWPVYYLMVFIGFFLFQNVFIQNIEFNIPKIPTEKYNSSLVHYLMFLPNNSPASNPVCFQAWSIGIEEQFYLFWPLIFFFIKKNKSRILLLLGIYFTLPLLKLAPRFFPEVESLEILKFYLARARFEDMALGGIVALLMFKNRIPKYFIMQLGLIFFLGIFLIIQIKLPFNIESILYPLLFVNLIIFTISYASAECILEHKVFKFLGKISYGLYMYHILAIYLVANIFPSFFKEQSLFSILLVHVVVICFSIAIAYISYSFMERPILRLKEKFSKIK